MSPILDRTVRPDQGKRKRLASKKKLRHAFHDLSKRVKSKKDRDLTKKTKGSEENKQDRAKKRVKLAG